MVIVMANEQWKQINANGKIYDYEVSNQGRIRNMKTGRILKSRPNNWGYHVVGLRHEGKQDWYSVHKLVALHFIENDDVENKTQVNHINEIVCDNCVENLEWVTPKENLHHGTRTTRSVASNSKPVYYIDEESRVAVVYPSSTCTELDGYSRSGVSQCCNPNCKAKTHKGKEWHYVGGTTPIE